jgi:predicted ester cyclase
MHAGVVKSKYKKSDLDKAVKQYKETALPAITSHEGGRSALLLVNRDTGDTLSIAMYADEASAKSFAPKAEKLIASFDAYTAEDAKPQRELYEIVLSTQMEARAVVERLIKAINAHDLEAAARETTSDTVLTAPGDMTVKGTQAAKEYNKNWITAFPDAKIEVQKIFAQGNDVAIKAQFVGTHNGTLKTPMGDVPATGRKLRGDFQEVFEVDRGLIKNAHLLFDQVQLMTQLGMAPAPQPQGQKAAR